MQLSAQLKSLATQCSSLSDIAIKYYATELPPKVDTSLDGLVKLIEEFPLRLAKSDHPEGVPLKVTVIPNNQLSTANSGKNGKTSYGGFNLDVFITSLRLSKPQSAASTTKTVFPENNSNSSKCA